MLRAVGGYENRRFVARRKLDAVEHKTLAC